MKLVKWMMALIPVFTLNAHTYHELNCDGECTQIDYAHRYVRYQISEIQERMDDSPTKKYFAFMKGKLIAYEDMLMYLENIKNMK